MSEHDAEALQFDNAEFDAPPPGPTCAACKRPIPDAYYELFGAVVCESCRDVIIAGREGGSKLGRFFRDNGLFTFLRWSNFTCIPPLCITEAELHHGFEIVDRALDVVDADFEG